MDDRIMYVECVICKEKIMLAKSFGFWVVDLGYNGDNIEDFLNRHMHGRMSEVHFILRGES